MSNAVLVLSHRRSGTHLTLDTILHNFQEVSLDFLVMESLYSKQDNHVPKNDFQQQLETPQVTLLKAHLPSNLDHLKDKGDIYNYIQSLIQSTPKIYVYRDGRDVMVSLYFYTQAYNPKIKGMGFSDFLRMEPTSKESQGYTNTVEFWVYHVRQWLQQDVIAVTYEDLLQDSESVLQRLAGTFGWSQVETTQEIQLQADKPQTTTWTRLRNKVFGEDSPTSLSSAVEPRKGIIGDWKNHFSDEDLSFFNQVAGDLMAELGYD